jgi:hypothetical protein
MKVGVSQTAVADLEAIADWIAQDSPRRLQPLPGRVPGADEGEGHITVST